MPALGDSGSRTNRKRQVGQGFNGGGAKAAGFNRNDFNMTNDFSNASKQAGGIDLTANAGVGSQNMMGPKKTIEKEDTSRPPLYVPSQRASLVKKPVVDVYQPTIMSREGRGGNEDINSRYKPSLFNDSQGQTTSSFGVQSS